MDRRQFAQERAPSGNPQGDLTRSDRVSPTAAGAGASDRVAAPRVLVVGRRGRTVSDRLTPWACEAVPSADDARRTLTREIFDAALIDADVPAGLGLVRDLAGADAGVAVILIAENPSVDFAMEAMRSGAADILSPALGAEECQGRVRRAIERAGRVRDRDLRIDRLQKICRKLNDARHQVTRQIGTLCNDLVEAYQELTDQVSSVTIASEFNGIIRQELDVESLLRTALEFVLAKVGPTNAAVFLPATSSDYSLGAYVNYDCPKDTADVLLDHLANVVPARMEGREGIVASTTARDLENLLGADAHWLAECEALTFNCRHDGETLAVVILFRDRTTPFGSTAPTILRVVADLFGRQLARVIRVHHRHLPREQWGGFAEPDDDADLAA